MVGTAVAPYLKMKAMECWGLVHFLVAERRSQRAILGLALADKVIECGECMIQYINTMKSCRIVVTPGEVQVELNGRIFTTAE